MNEYHLSLSNGIWYCFAFDGFHRPIGRFKSPDFRYVTKWIQDNEGFSYPDGSIYSYSTF